MKVTGHKSHVSGWRRFQREFRRRDERKDLARFVQRARKVTQDRQRPQAKVLLDKRNNQC